MWYVVPHMQAFPVLCTVGVLTLGDPGVKKTHSGKKRDGVHGGGMHFLKPKAS